MRFQTVSGNVLCTLLSSLQLEMSYWSFLLDELGPRLRNAVESSLPFRKQNALKGLDNDPLSGANFTYIMGVKKYAAIAKPTGAIQHPRNSECESDHSEEPGPG